MARTFTREEFYDLVWSKPMTHLAKEFALSDVALHKVCKKHGIPNPPLGWWAKKAAGQPVKQTPLPPLKGGGEGRITIASGELRPEPELIATARENARILASTIEAGEAVTSHPIVERTVAKLRKAKPAAVTQLASVEQSGLIKVDAALASADRLELVLNRIAATGAEMGIEIVRTEKAAAFSVRTISIPISAPVAAIRLSTSSSRSAEAKAASTLINPDCSTDASCVTAAGLALRSLATVRSTIGWEVTASPASIVDARMRAFSRAVAISSGSGRSSPLAIVILPSPPPFNGGSGVCFTGWPAAFFAHQPSGGLGMPCFLHTL